MDHGVFVPFLLIYPNADIPVLQLSLQRNLDPAEHIAMGRALAPLRDQGVLIVGSGNSYHNLRQFFDPRGIAPAEQFDRWLTQTVTDADPEARNRGLIAWDKAPGALECHPRAEHLRGVGWRHHCDRLADLGRAALEQGLERVDLRCHILLDIRRVLELREIVRDRLCAALAERDVVLLGARRIGVADQVDRLALRLLDTGVVVVEPLALARLDRRVVEPEVHGLQLAAARVPGQMDVFLGFQRRD